MAEYLLRLEPAEHATPLSVDLIEQAVRAHGLAPRHASRTDHGWVVQVGGNTAAAGVWRVPEGWRLVEERPVIEQMSWPGAGATRAVGDVFAFAFLLWPAVVGLFLLGADGWQLALRVALAVWLGLFHLVAYRQQRGAFFGNSMLMLSGCVAGFWWTHPGPWMYLWLVVILIGLYAAVRGTPRRSAPGSESARAPAAPPQESA